MSKRKDRRDLSEPGPQQHEQAGLELEKHDLQTLLLSFLAVPLTWLVFVGWTASKSAGAHDQLVSFFPLIQDFLETTRGDWTKFAYRPDLLGGVKIHDVIGTMPFFQFCGWLGLSALTTLNGILFFTQSLYAFLGTRIAYDLRKLWSPEDGARPPGWLERAGILFLTAMAPAIAWRMTAGHFALILETLVWVSLFALLLAARNRTHSLSLVAVSVLAQIQAFPTTGQMHFYGPVFGGAILIAAALPLRPWRKFLLPACVIAGSILVSLPKLAGMVVHATSSDAGRSLGGGSVIYSYVTGTLGDWISSIPWGNELIPTGRAQIFWHEVNFAFGPLLLPLALVPWRRVRWIGAGLAASFFLAVLYSNDFPGAAALLTFLVPPLKAFRVPERSILVFTLLLPAFASAALLTRFGGIDRRQWPAAAAALAAGLVAFAAPPWFRELLAWSGCGVLVFSHFLAWDLRARVPAAAALLFLGLASVGAFKERMMGFAPEEALVRIPAQLSGEVIRGQPSLASPLERIMMGFGMNEFQTSTAYAMRISSLNGYLNPPRRFLALEAALAGKAENGLLNYFSFNDTNPGFPFLRQLYNVRLGALAKDNQVTIGPIGETAGPAWFSAAISRVDDFPALAQALKAPGDKLWSEAHARLWVVKSDPVLPAAALPADIAPECAKSQVLGVDSRRGEQTFRIHVRNGAVCPLTLAMNYTVNLHARSGSNPLPVFPAYGALAATLVPPGATEVVVEARAYVPLWSEFGWLVGMLLIGFAFWETRRQRLEPPASAPVAAES